MSKSHLLSDAQAFLAEWRSDSRGACPYIDEAMFESRLAAIAEEIEASGTYTHTAEELAYGAKLAWRNSNRCIGRHFWRTLQVRDARNVTAPDDVLAALHHHMEAAFNGGKIRSFITVFPPRDPKAAQDKVRIANHQLIRYAGFPSDSPDNDSVLGDPNSADFTARQLARGWQPRSRSAFTPLPWEIHWEGEALPPYDVFSEHPDRLHEVRLSHPDFPALAAQGWKWYALPLLSELALKIGGVLYPCAPFNGYYMGTEIGARSLADVNRYDLLPQMADLMGLDRSTDRSLWRDRAMVELNRAVLHSFDAAGITIGDHHGLGDGFERFCQSESRQGREVTGDWVWLNPPMTSPQTPQFHREYTNSVVEHTNYFYQPGPGEWAAQYRAPSPSDCPFHLSGS